MICAGETRPQHSTFDLFVFTTHFPTDTVRYDGSSGGVQFSLCNKFLMHTLGIYGEGGNNVQAFLI